MRCLALNASFEPLTMVPVRRALRLVIDGNAEIVEAEGAGGVRDGGRRQYQVGPDAGTGIGMRRARQFGTGQHNGQRHDCRAGREPRHFRPAHNDSSVANTCAP